MVRAIPKIVMNPDDLAKVAELIDLAASTVRLFSESDLTKNGQMSRVTDLARQLNSIASELAHIAQSFENGETP